MVHPEVIHKSEKSPPKFICMPYHQVKDDRLDEKRKNLAICHHGVMDLWTLSDLCTPWCVRVVATLRIADHIVAGNPEIDQLATAALDMRKQASLSAAIAQRTLLAIAANAKRRG